MSIFNPVSFKYFGKRNYSELTENSQEIVDFCVHLINSKYHCNYESKNACGIEPDGCCNWFYIGFHDASSTERDEDGNVWFIIHSNVSRAIDVPAGASIAELIEASRQQEMEHAKNLETFMLDENDKGVVLNEEQNFIRNHAFKVLSAFDYYR